MRNSATWRRLGGWMCVLLLGPLGGGCPALLTGLTDDTEPVPVISTPPAITSTATHSGSTVNLSDAQSLGLGADKRQARFRGTIARRGDIGFYSLGWLETGDGIVVDVQRISGNLDAVAGVFDSEQSLVFINDDRNVDGTNLNPYIDFALPGASGEYFLGVIAFPGSSTTGDFEVSVVIQPAVGAAPPRQQIVFLNWAGGSNIRVLYVGTFNLPPFSATDVGLPAEQTAPLKVRVQEIVADRYRGYNVLVLNSDDHAVPIGPHSTVHFGGRDPDAFAISQQVDSLNQDPADDAIVFTQTFQLAFRAPYTLEEMAQALGNTTAHEIGHLLGLSHTADCDCLMDTTCYNERLMSPQEFKLAPLDFSVFPFGYQDARELLMWAVGFISG